VIHHVSIRTRDLARVEEFYRVLGFQPEIRFSTGPRAAAWLVGPHGRIELIDIADPAMDAAMDTDVSGEPERLGYNHLALEVADLDELLERLRGAQAGEVEAPSARQLAGRTYRVAFVRDPEGVLLELIEPSP
jgi:glyoxylase I family protein